MADEEQESPGPPAEEVPRARRRTMTPEQRRFMGTQRAAEEAEEPAPAPIPVPEATPVRHESRPARETGRRSTRERPAPLPHTSSLQPDTEESRRWEMQTPLVILGVIVLLVSVFYIGKKFDLLRSQVAAERDATSIPMPRKNSYTGAPDDLVAQALEAERANDFGNATDLFLAARQKDQSYRGILFHLGKGYFARGQLEEADKFFDRAIAQRENLGQANQQRALVAERRSDLPAAKRFAEAAIKAEPFNAQYRSYLGDVLRRDHHPNEAVSHYERARLVASDAEAATANEFKVRMARLEAGDFSQIRNALDEKRVKGAKLSADWLLTAAALELREAHVEEAAGLIQQARATQQPLLFAACTQDSIFEAAAHTYPVIADAIAASAP